MHNSPLNPLDELHNEVQRLRNLLSYTATCLYKTQWKDEEDLQYATSLGEHIDKQIGNNVDDENFKGEQALAEQIAMTREDEARNRWLRSQF